jgi:hypothetical protein
MPSGCWCQHQGGRQHGRTCMALCARVASARADSPPSSTSPVWRCTVHAHEHHRSVRNDDYAVLELGGCALPLHTQSTYTVALSTALNWCSSQSAAYGPFDQHGASIFDQGRVSPSIHTACLPYTRRKGRDTHTVTAGRPRINEHPPKALRALTCLHPPHLSRPCLPQPRFAHGGRSIPLK